MTDEDGAPIRVEPRPRSPKDCRSRQSRSAAFAYVIGTLAASVWLGVYGGEFLHVWAPRWTAFVGGAVVGAVLVAFLRASDRTGSRRRDALVAAHAADPWTVDNAWTPRGTSFRQAGSRRRRRWIDFVPPLACVVAFGAVLVFRVSLGPRWYYGLFAAAGAMVVWVAWAIRRASALGESHLLFDRFPFFVGERVEMTFGMDEGAAHFDAVRFVLRRYAEDPSPEGVVSNRVVFEREFVPEGGVLPGPDNYVRLAFDIPADAGGTALSARWPRYWELEVAGETSQGPYRVMFLVPVYERPAIEVPRRE